MLPSTVTFHPTQSPAHLPSHALVAGSPRKTAWNLPSHFGCAMQHGFVTHEEVNHALQDDTSTMARRTVAIRHEHFTLPPELERYRDSAMCHARANASVLYNEQKIRLTTDLYWLVENRSVKPLVVQPTDYYTSLCSNAIANHVGMALGSDTPEDLFGYVQNDQGNLIDLYDSQLSNHLGAGTLGLTPYGGLVIARQGLRAHVNAGLYVPAGSGSLDWSDLLVSGHLGINGLITLGVERELREECGYRPRDIQKTLILGFGRNVQCGGEPTFFGLTLLGPEATMVMRPEEIGLVEHCPPLPLVSTSIEGLRRELAGLIQEWTPLSSTALLMNMQLLMDASDATLHTVLQHMQYRQ